MSDFPPPKTRTSRVKYKTIHTFVLGSFFNFAISLLLGFTYKSDCLSDTKYYPQSAFTLERIGYTLSYDGRTKGASWVYECLTPELFLIDSVSRDGFSFHEDEEIPDFLRSTNGDFRGSGYDRGHLCPSGDCKASREAMGDSFLLSNISPQVPSFNRGIWRELELYIRQLAIEGKTLHVYTVPLFLPEEVNGKRFVHYQVIGNHDVAVPTHFAKVAIFDGEDLPLAYILPNRQIPKNVSIDAFRTTIEKVERAAGMIFPRIDEISHCTNQRCQ